MEGLAVSSMIGVWVQMSPGVRRRVLAVGKEMLNQEVEFQPGGVVDMHSHPHEQVCYIARGTLAFIVGDKEVELKEGDSLVVPGGTPHGCRAGAYCLALDTFHPIREDYLVPPGS